MLLPNIFQAYFRLDNYSDKIRQDGLRQHCLLVASEQSPDEYGCAFLSDNRL
jgi:hypothetical protein